MNAIEFVWNGIKYIVGMYIIFLGSILAISFPVIPFIQNGTVGAALFSLVFGGSLIFTGVSIVGKDNL
jgi:hypothetical protein